MASFAKLEILRTCHYYAGAFRTSELKLPFVESQECDCQSDWNHAATIAPNFGTHSFSPTEGHSMFGIPQAHVEKAWFPDVRLIYAKAKLMPERMVQISLKAHCPDDLLWNFPA